VSWWKRTFGVDWFDTLVHVGITFALMVIVEGKTHEAEPVTAVAITGAVLYSIRRYFALRKYRQTGELSGETTTGAHRQIDTEARLQDLEALYGRVAELEERLDFAERLLAKQEEAPRLEAPRA
jgi:hypothetical protein